MRWFGFPSLAATVALLLLGSRLALAQPAVQSVSPQGAAPGQTTTIIVRGAKLDEPLRVWTSFPAQVQIDPATPGQKGRSEVKLQVTVAADTPPQVGGILFATAEGLSDPVFFALDELPSVADNGQNHERTAAQEIAPLAAVDGTIEPAQADYFKVTAAAGQKIAFDVLAARLGSDLDPILRLWDESGRALATADDDDSLGPEARLSYTFASAGTYVLELRDVRHRGGANFRYRLRVGDFPLVAATYPLAVTAGQAVELSFAGSAGENLPPLKFTASALTTPTAASTVSPVAVRYEGGKASAFASVIVSPLPQTLEAEPNDAAEGATRFALPGGIQGRFQAPGDRDGFVCDLKANTGYVFRPVSRSIGSPCYVQLALFKPDGNLLAAAPVGDADEAPLVVTPPADGAYRLVATELLRRGGPGYTYYVEATPQTGVGPHVKADKNTPHKLAIPKGGAASLEVQAGRAGFDGALGFNVAAAGREFSVLQATIGEKQPATKLIVFAPSDASPSEVFPLRLTASGDRGGQKFAAPLATTAMLRAKWPQLAYPPAWLDGLVPAAITDEIPEVFAVTPAAATFYYPRGAAQASFTLAMQRKHAEFKDPLLVIPPQMPPGLTSEVKREGNGKDEKYIVTLRAPPDAAEVKHDLSWRCLGEVKGQWQVRDVPLAVQLVTPLTLSVTPEGPIAPGQKQKLKLALARFNPGSGEDKQAVTLKWTKLPPGVTAAGDATIAADQTEVVVELAAAADAALGVFDGVVVTAHTMFHGNAAHVESAPVKWEVKAP